VIVTVLDIRQAAEDLTASQPASQNLSGLG
jgi:hypothetical protein